MTPFDMAETLTRPAPAFGAAAPVRALTDPFGRVVDYLRVSVTDRCDLRCVYCMSERPSFLPKSQVLSIEDLDRLASAFVGLGVRRLRLTGGEPLVRRGFMELVERLSRHLRSGALDELTLTTNATRLAEHAGELARVGVRRINVSLDSLDPQIYRTVTRGGDLARTLDGIEAARTAGLQVKINVVALRDANLADLPAMVAWAHGQGFDLSLIEVMPLGDVGQDRVDQHVSLAEVRRTLEAVWTLEPIGYSTCGPARYVRVAETGGRLGFITPLSHNFCEGCNRVRLTCTGVLYPCLGQDASTDLGEALRQGEDMEPAIRAAIARKPKGHDFHIDRRGAAPAVGRSMAATGG